MFRVRAGDVVVFPPRSVHGIDVDADGRMYSLQMMLPNDMFAQLVHSGEAQDALDEHDLCTLLAVGCSLLGSEGGSDDVARLGR